MLVSMLLRLSLTKQLCSCLMLLDREEYETPLPVCIKSKLFSAAVPDNVCKAQVVDPDARRSDSAQQCPHVCIRMCFHVSHARVWAHRACSASQNLQSDESLKFSYTWQTCAARCSGRAHHQACAPIGRQFDPHVQASSSR